MAVDSDGHAFRAFGIRRLPAVALIGAEGRLVGIVGPDERALLVSARRLSRKWCGPAWLDERILEPPERGGYELPDVHAEHLPPQWLPYATFEKSFAR